MLKERINKQKKVHWQVELMERLPEVWHVMLALCRTGWSGRSHSGRCAWRRAARRLGGRRLARLLLVLGVRFRGGWKAVVHAVQPERNNRTLRSEDTQIQNTNTVNKKIP